MSSKVEWKVPMAWSLEEFNQNKPKVFDPENISRFLNFLDRARDSAEISFDESKDQINEVFDFVSLEKKSNNNVSMAEAKAQATQDKRYKEVKEKHRKSKALHLYWKSLAKNGWSHCENLKQQSINQLAIDKLTRTN
tara:strand:- start:194 stop:604 length:411 start_codon:yes stop_codon:yes gene_type:complete